MHYDIAEYSARACVKLRGQGSLVKEIYVFATTATFEHFWLNHKLDILTDDTRIITKVAKQIIKRMYKKGIRYRKVGIILVDLLSQVGPLQLPLFDNNQYTDNKKTECLMKIMDMLNKPCNKGFYAAQVLIVHGK